MAATALQLRRLTGRRTRLDAAQARTDRRGWVMARRERTRHLIELGGLVQKAGLVDLLDDDRSALLGGLLALVDQLRAEDGGQVVELWRRRGRRTFAADRETPPAILAAEER